MTSVDERQPTPPPHHAPAADRGRSKAKIAVIVAVVTVVSAAAVLVMLAVVGAVFWLRASEAPEPAPGQVVGPGDSRDLLGTYQEFYFPTRADWPGADGLTESWGIPVPASATDIHLAEDGFQDPYYHVRFTVDTDELPTIIDAPACGGLLTQEQSAIPGWTATQPVDWWTPETATSYGTCADEGVPNGARLVFVDRTDPDVAVIYLVLHTF